MHKFTSEQAEFIKENVIGKSRKELMQMVNDYFGLNLKVTQITAYIKNHGLANGLDGRFGVGHTPANKGVKGMGGWEPTQFKEGHRPHNYKPVGTVRINTDGYVDIKIADPKTWRGKHLLVWEEHNGTIPKGHAVIFGDGDRRNFDINNLILVTKTQLAILNTKKLIQGDADLTRTGVIIADLYHKVSVRKSNR